MFQCNCKHFNHVGRQHAFHLYLLASAMLSASQRDTQTGAAYSSHRLGRICENVLI